MKRTIFMVMVVLTIIMVSGCINPPPPPPQTENSVFIYPKTVYTDLDSEFDISVLCNIKDYICAWECEVEFDPQELYLVNVSFSDEVFDWDSNFNSPNINVDQMNGTITRLYSVLLGKVMVRNSGSLFTMHFITDSYGSTEVKLRNFHLYNLTSQLPVNVENATIVITNNFFMP